MGILSKIRSYNGKWNVVSKDAFDAFEISEVVKNEVVPSEFGNSVKLSKRDGTTQFLPVSNTSREVHPGESVDLAKCFVLTLGRTGSDDIYRIEIL